MGELNREKEYLYWLCRIPLLGAVAVRKIWEETGSFETAFYIEGTQLAGKGIFRNAKQAAAFDQAKTGFRAAVEEYHGLAEQGIRFITFFDEEYPLRLRHIYDYPMGLWLKGRLPEEHKPSAAIIGARSCTSYGAQVAEHMGRELSMAGVQVISGLAMGIDGAGHRGALMGNGGTWGILGCGVNICYPKRNYPVYREMLKRGGIFSEFPPGQPPRSCNFPIRNRLISGLADVVLVIEARQKSGSLITANLGLDQGKEIFALPGRVTDVLSTGCNQLIQSGASILTCPGDVLEYMGIIHEKKLILYEKNTKGLAKNEKMVYSCLDSAPKHVEEVAALTGLAVSTCMSALLELELDGLALNTTGQFYTRRL